MTCAECREVTSRPRRHLCNRCYRRHLTRGTHLDFQAVTWRNSDLMADWTLLRSEGFSRLQAAHRLGISKARLEKAIERSREVAA